MKTAEEKAREMRMKKLLCKLFGHKWEYKQHISGSTDMRVCKRCAKLQKWYFFGLKQFWTDCVMYTDKGAKENIEGYGK